jgi:hypothetical protein
MEDTKEWYMPVVLSRTPFYGKASNTSWDSINEKTPFIFGVDRLTRLTMRTDYLYIQIEEMPM